MSKQPADQFINISFRLSTLDRYFIRGSIFNSIVRLLPQLQGRLLDAGCGKMPYKKFILENSRITDYVGLDIDSALVYDSSVRPDYTWDGNVMPFRDNEFDAVMATEVLEHCPDPGKFLSEVNRVLKPGGIFFFTVPFLWNLHEVPHDEYRYTPFALRRLLINSSFTSISVFATGGWHASLAQMLGLWARRSVSSRTMKKILSILVAPVVYLLLRFDRVPVEFKEGVISPGFYGTGIKAQ